MNTTNSSEEVPLSAMEKVAWVEMVVSLMAVGIVLSLIPWLGDRASQAFALLAFVGLGYRFTRNRQGKVLLDERDQEIVMRSRLFGAEVTWMFLVVSLIVILMWVGRMESISVMAPLNWLIWTQFVVWFVARSLVTLFSYRKQRHAS